MIPKNMAITGIYLLHKSWFNIQKNDHMIATNNYKHMFKISVTAAAAVQKKGT
jgi:hypothetical protein